MMLKAVNNALSRVHAIVATVVLGAAFIAAPVSAQTYLKGQHIEPAYEGWEQNPDGSYSFIFGYHNENWEEELDIPVGENNFFSPGAEDRGQPTHFQPRRNRFTFKVQVPEDWGDQELTWTITSPNGETRTTYATLDKDYVVDHVVIASETGSLGAGTSTPESRANTPPQVSIIGDTVRSVRVGEPLELRVQVTDDGLPQPGRVASLNRSASANAQREIQRFLRAPSRVTVGKVNGLFLSWSVYRGEGETEFMPQQVKSWEDTRASANSPWGAYFKPPAVPEDGVYESSVTFKEPGRYVLWARADDGGLFADQYLEVNVTP
ncbi:MAG: hypothetical protein P1V33_06965 [Pseudohongiella nitratireducens]|nr:hypothetical protein [Pseudohongiella nitratireducens]MDF1623190.1 hypothetical protein [Pseudohongiella nitratireducens]